MNPKQADHPSHSISIVIYLLRKPPTHKVKRAIHLIARKMLQHEYHTMREVEDTYWWYQVLRTEVASDLSHFFGAGKPCRLLDAGCGTGGMLHTLREAHPEWEMAGLDVSAVAVEYCRERGFADVMNGSVDRMPFSDAIFDVVLSLDVLSHKEVSEEHAMSEMARVVRPGGYIILNLQAFDVLRGRHDIAVHAARRYTIERVRKLLEPVALTGEAIFYWNAWLFVPLLAWRLMTRFGKRPEEIGTRGDLSQVPPQINALLTTLGRLDFAACRRLHPPFGTSVYTVARKL
jgi:ubiquinone/menaquinone biosynthesis C-methylase UbiE